MERKAMVEALGTSKDPWDIIIIGGGATGLGCAVEAASRGYRTALLEQSDFAKATSSRSTKLIHGGVRYLQRGNVGLVIQSLRERGRLMQNAPHLVKKLAFAVPNYDWWERLYYGAGLKLYDLLAGKLGLGRSKRLSREETLRCLPTLQSKGLRGSICYYDGQFDDARLAIALARTAADHGAIILNYMRVAGLHLASGQVRGVVAQDLESGQEHELSARSVINATGVFVDEVRRMSEPDAVQIIVPSQGAHIVLDRSFLPGDCALMVPKTDDGRVLFAIPWHDRVIIGTTDTTIDRTEVDPRPQREELEFLLGHASRYLAKSPQASDVLSVFAGLRPLVKTGKTKDTALVPRDHTVIASRTGLITVTGGKWTTYRKMGEDAVKEAIRVGGLANRPGCTAQLKLHGYRQDDSISGHWSQYGADLPLLHALRKENREWDQPLHPALPYLVAEVVWAVRHEMARTVEDVLARRTRALILDARASMEAAPQVAEIMATALRMDAQWQERQVAEYSSLATRYLYPD